MGARRGGEGVFLPVPSLGHEAGISPCWLLSFPDLCHGAWHGVSPPPHTHSWHPAHSRGAARGGVPIVGADGRWDARRGLAPCVPAARGAPGSRNPPARAEGGIKHPPHPISALGEAVPVSPLPTLLPTARGTPGGKGGDACGAAAVRGGGALALSGWAHGEVGGLAAGSGWVWRGETAAWGRSWLRGGLQGGSAPHPSCHIPALSPGGVRWGQGPPAPLCVWWHWCHPTGVGRGPWCCHRAPPGLALGFCGPSWLRAWAQPGGILGTWGSGQQGAVLCCCCGVPGCLHPIILKT